MKNDLQVMLISETLLHPPPLQKLFVDTTSSSNFYPFFPTYQTNIRENPLIPTILTPSLYGHSTTASLPFLPLHKCYSLQSLGLSLWPNPPDTPVFSSY